MGQAVEEKRGHEANAEEEGEVQKYTYICLARARAVLGRRNKGACTSYTSGSVGSLWFFFGKHLLDKTPDRECTNTLAHNSVERAYCINSINSNSKTKTGHSIARAQGCGWEERARLVADGLRVCGHDGGGERREVVGEERAM